MRYLLFLFVLFPAVALAANVPMSNGTYVVSDGKATYSGAHDAVTGDAVYGFLGDANVIANGYIGNKYYVRKAGMEFDTSAYTDVTSAKLWFFIPPTGGVDTDGYSVEVVDGSNLIMPLTTAQFGSFSSVSVASKDLTQMTNLGGWTSITLPVSSIVQGITKLALRLSGDIANMVPTGYNTLRIDTTQTPYLELFTGSTGGSLLVNEIEANKIFQRQAGVASVPVNGTYSGTPASIEARVVSGATEIVPWTAIAFSGGVYSDNITVPEGGWYKTEVRFSNDPAVTITSSNQYGVGILVGVIGQSIGDQWFYVGNTLSPNALTQKYKGSWQTNTGDGSIAFANDLATTYGVPVGMFHYTVDGTCLLPNLHGTDWWLNPNGMYKTFKNAVNSQGGSLEYVLWLQGECDAYYGGTYQTYKDGLATLDSNLANDIGDTPFLISLIGRWTGGGNHAETQAIRDAQEDYANETANVYIGATIQDLPAVDTVHLTNEGYKMAALRMAHTVKYLLGTETYYEGPKITGYSINGGEVTVNITHKGGADFTPATNITGFEVLDDGVPETILSAVHTSPSAIKLTISGTVDGTPTVRYLYGNTLDVAGLVFDNSTMNLPLRGTKNVPNVGYIPTTMLFYDSDGLGCTMVTTLNGVLQAEITTCP